jgi:hypothetical protein
MSRSLEAVSPLLMQLERDRQERIESAQVAALDSGDALTRRIEAAAIGALKCSGLPVETPLAACAAWHEREATRYHVMWVEACAEDCPEQARSCADAEAMHARMAVACREADGK